MSNTLTGKAIVIGKTETFASGFTKRQLVIETTDGKYPQTIPIDFIKDAGQKLDAVGLGDLVEVSIDIRGREHNGKYYASIQGWKVEVTDKAAGTVSIERPAEAAAEEEDDGEPLPF